MPFLTASVVFLLVAFFGSASHAGEADVVSTDVSCTDQSICSFAVTVRPADEGWEHYADKWEVLTRESGFALTIQSTGMVARSSASRFRAELPAGSGSACAA